MRRPVGGGGPDQRVSAVSGAAPPRYRRFAGLAFVAAGLGGVPLGAWMLIRLHLGTTMGGPVPPAWVLLHAHLQVFGFFATLIVGVAQHLVPRFAGHPGARSRALDLAFGGLVLGLLARVAGTPGGPAGLLAATLVELGAFALFAAWLWRTLATPSVALTRAYLGLATAWLVAALALEAGARAQALAAGTELPDPGLMRAVHAMALLGGVGGWILGVALRAAPMFVPRWHVPEGLARGAPWGLALGVLLVVAAEAGRLGPAAGVALARLGEAVALGAIATVVVTGGALRRRGRALLLAGTRGPELWIFRLAVASLLAAALGSGAAAGLAAAGIPLSLLADALRHLTTVGFLTAMVVAMAFRLIPVLEGAPLPWPGLRTVAFAALLAAVGLRSAQVLADYGLPAVLPWLPLSGLFVWVALACVAASFGGAIRGAGGWGGDGRPAGG